MNRVACICCLSILLSGCPVPQGPGEPTAAFLADVTTSTSRGLTVQFTDMSLENGAAITEWHWNFGDGTTSDEQDPIHQFTGCQTAGFFDVSLRVTNANGSDIHVEENLIDLQGCRED